MSETRVLVDGLEMGGNARGADLGALPCVCTELPVVSAQSVEQPWLLIRRVASSLTYPGEQAQPDIVPATAPIGAWHDVHARTWSQSAA